MAQKSADFIEERISIINHELGTTETELAEFKQRAGLTDISSDAQLALQESSKYEQQYAENATQINLVNYLRDYINNPANNDEIIPAKRRTERHEPDLRHRQVQQSHRGA